MRILVIDDETEIRELLSDMLGEEGFEILTAANGVEGIRMIEATPEIDIVITDLIMPEKEGVETIRELKRDFPGIKIMAISGGGRVGPEAHLSIAQAVGADVTLEKPFVKEELLNTLHKLLQHH